MPIAIVQVCLKYTFVSGLIYNLARILFHNVGHKSLVCERGIIVCLMLSPAFLGGWRVGGG